MLDTLSYYEEAWKRHQRGLDPLSIPRGRVLSAELMQRAKAIHAMDKRSERIAATVRLLDDIHAGRKRLEDLIRKDPPQSARSKKFTKNLKASWQRSCGNFLDWLGWINTGSRKPGSWVATAYARWAKANKGPSALTGEAGPWRFLRADQYRQVALPAFVLD